jgi:glycosyltransferase involved in cell wall biosynthesis
MEKLKTCYAVILVSLGDISPNMILEAIQCKKPFILTRANGLESRIHGLGLRVNPLDEEDIAQAICRLANSSVYEQEKHNIEAFSFRHSYGGIARDFLNIFEKL